MKKTHVKIMAIPIWLTLLAGCNPDEKVEPPVVKNSPPIAVVQAPEVVNANFKVTLNAEESHDADEDELTYRWEQVSGPDVTNGAGFLTGETVSFSAPSEVSTLKLNLIVNDGEDDSQPESIAVNVLENTAAAYYVDGDLGSDTEGVGTREAPFASITKALCSVTKAQQDIYVKNKANNGIYSEKSDTCSPVDERSQTEWLTVPTGTSLYGGYDEYWHRDVTNSTLVDTVEDGFTFTDVDQPAWFSGFNVLAQDAKEPGVAVSVISVTGGNSMLTIADNQLIAGDVAAKITSNPQSSYGVRVGYLSKLRLERNEISSGAGGNAISYEVVFSSPAPDGANGKNASGTSGGSGGDGRGTLDYDGGKGGDNNSSGKSGEGRTNKNAGKSGAPGRSGNGSGYIAELITPLSTRPAVVFRCGNGFWGSYGYDGYGGNGGDGGDNAWPNNGGGGGGGGGGGQGGAGGRWGVGGCASIGVLLNRIEDVQLTDNTIISSNGGYGGSGSRGQLGGDGGKGGAGAKGNCTGWCAKNGKNGGAGQAGGNGGRGGAGGGGPSYGVLVGSQMSPLLTGNDIRSGNGGNGGFGGVNGHGGEGGYSYAIYDTNLNDGIVPVLSDNTLSFGEPGLGGNSTGTVGEPGNKGKAAATNW